MAQAVQKRLPIWLRRVGYFLGLLGLLAALAAWGLPQLLDPNRYAQRITQKVKAETGRTLHLGPMQLKVFPWLRLVAEDVHLGNAAGFLPPSMLTLARLEVGVKLWPLLRDGRVVVDVVRLQRPQLDLRVNAAGRSNWQDLLEWQRKRPASEPLDLDLAGLELHHGTLRFADDRSGQHVFLTPLTLTSSRIYRTLPVKVFATSGLVTSTPALAGQFTLQAVVDWQARTQTLLAENFTARWLGALAKPRAVAINTTLFTPKVQLQLSPEGLWSAAPTQLSIHALQVAQAVPINPAVATARRAPTQAAEPPFLLFGQLQATPSFNPSSGGAALQDGDLQLQVRASSRVDQGAFSPASAQWRALTWQGQTRKLTVQALRAAALNLKLEANAQALLPSDAALEFFAQAKVATFDLRQLIKRLQIAWLAMPANALRRVAIEAEIAVQRHAQGWVLQLPALKTQIDQSLLSGRLKILQQEAFSAQFDAQIDQIQLQDYLPPPQAKPGRSSHQKPVPATARNPVQWLEIAPLDQALQQLQTLPVQGQLRVGLLQWQENTAKNVVLDLLPNGSKPAP